MISCRHTEVLIDGIEVERNAEKPSVLTEMFLPAAHTVGLHATLYRIGKKDDLIHEITTLNSSHHSSMSRASTCFELVC